MDGLDQLQHLVRIDMDALRAYAQAIDNVDDQSVRNMLTGFRHDHERHVETLSAAIAEMGGTVPKQPHFAGFALAGMTGVAAGMGVSSALMVMQSNEIVTNQAYDLALSADLPEPVRELVEQNREDERRHLKEISSRLRRSSPVGPMLSGSATMQGYGTSIWMNVVRTSPVATALAATGAALMLGNALFRRGREADKPR